LSGAKQFADNASTIPGTYPPVRFTIVRIDLLQTLRQTFESPEITFRQTLLPLPQFRGRPMYQANGRG
jgi:hypothetical protein